MKSYLIHRHSKKSFILFPGWPTFHTCLVQNSPVKMLHVTSQRAKKVVFNSLGLVDFATRLVNSAFNLPNGQDLPVGQRTSLSDVL